MIIIQLMGELGNQMFQYALYLKLKSLGRNVYFDASFYREKENHGIRMDRYFPVTIPLANKESLLQLGNVNRKLTSRIRRKIFGKRGNVFIDTIDAMQPEVFGMNNVYLSGYWQCEKYFSGVEGQVKKAFTMKNHLTGYQKMMLDEIRGKESVSVYIRKGDYLKYKDRYGGICTEEYYEKTMKYFYDRPESHFFIFSNDFGYAEGKYGDLIC